MEIQGPGGVPSPERIEPERLSAPRAHEFNVNGKVEDHAEISEEARLLNALAKVPDIRLELIKELQALIASGKYETPERIQQAVDKILEEI